MSGPPASQALLPNLAPLGLRDLPQDAVDVIVDRLLEKMTFRDVCETRWLQICQITQNTDACNDPNDRIWKAACKRMGLNRIVRYTGAPTTWRGTLRALCKELNDTGDDAFGALRFAIDKDDFEDQFHLMHILPRKGCPLAIAVLLDHGCDSNYIVGRRRPPLCAAAKHGHLAVVEVLLAGGANPDLPTASGKTALMIACEKSNPQIVKVLLAAGANMEARDEDAGSALMYASLSGSYLVVRELFEHTPPPAVDTYDGSDWTPLMLAVESMVPETVKELLKHRPWVNAANIDGWTPIMLASKNYQGRTEIVDAILATNDVNLNMRNELGETALIVAAKLGNVAIVKALLAYLWRPDVNAQDNRGFTALMHAAWQGGPDELLSALLDAGADVHLKSAEGQTAFSLYAQPRFVRSLPAPPELWNRLQGRDLGPEGEIIF